MIVGAMLTLVLLPLASLVSRSFPPDNTWLYYRELTINRTSSIFYVPPAVAIRNSLVLR